MTEILNEKRIYQLIDKIDKSLFVNGPILPCTLSMKLPEVPEVEQ